MSKRLHSVFFIIFPEIACNFGEKYLNLHHIFKIGNIFFRKIYPQGSRKGEIA